MSIRRTTAGLLSIGASLVGIAAAQNAPPAAATPPGQVYGFVNLIRSVSDLDKAVAFYHDVYSLEITSQDKTPVKDKATDKLGGLPGAKVRRAVLALPDTRFSLELVEYTGVKRTPIVLRLQDIGATNLDFRCRDANALWDAAKSRGATSMTAGNGTADQKNANGTATRFQFIHDPDGFINESTQPIPEPKSDAPAGRNVLSVSTSMISAYDDKLVTFYHALGIDPRRGNAAPWTAFREALTGTGHTSLRSTAMLIPNSPDRYSFLEYAESDGKPFHGNLQDPGVSMFSLKVHDAAAAAKAAAGAGGSVVSAGGQPVKMSKDTRVIVRDVNGFYLELIQE
jgi:predicted enzyme related to lactoylglutathione lyase